MTPLPSLKLNWHISLALAILGGFTFLGSRPAHGADILQVTPSFAVSEIATDNLLFTPTNRQSDLGSNFEPGFSLALSGPAQSGSLQYETLAQVFAAHPQENSYFAAHELNVSDIINLSSLTQVTITDGLFIGNTSSALALLGQGAGPAVAGALPPLNLQTALGSTSTAINETNFFNLALNRTLTDTWSLQGAILQDFTTNVGSGITLFQGGSFGLTDHLDPDLSAGLNYAFDDFRTTGGGGEPGQFHYLQLQTTWTPLVHLTLQGAIGPIITRTWGTNGNYGAQLGFSASATYTGKRWVVALSGSQAPGLSPGVVAGLTRTAGASANYMFSHYTSVFTYVNYFEYPGSQSSSTELIYGVGVSTQWTRWLTLSVQYMGLQGSFASAGNAPSSSGSQSMLVNDFIISATVTFNALRVAL